MKDTTTFTWIIAERTSAAAVRGAGQGLDELGALVDADVRILTVSAERGVEVPAGFTLPNGRTLPGGVLMVANIPPQGILFQGIL